MVQPALPAMPEMLAECFKNKAEMKLAIPAMKLAIPGMPGNQEIPTISWNPMIRSYQIMKIHGPDLPNHENPWSEPPKS